jgi:glycine/D-amino acid oxidase-like deaminating enzyme
VLVGERSQEQVAADPTQRHARKLLAQAARFFPALRGAGLERVTVGWRPMPADRLPLVGPLPGLPGVYLAVAHRGVTVAPALGRLVAREVAGGPPEPLLDAFRPGRFAARAAAVARQVDAVFEPGTMPSGGRG